MNWPKKLDKIFATITGCLTLVFSGFLSLNSNSVRQDTLYRCVAEKSKSNDYGYVYSTICYGENSSANVETAFSKSWSDNFMGASQIVPSSMNAETNELKNYSVSFGESGASTEVHIGNLCNYSIQTGSKRFETALINVYCNDLFNPVAEYEDSDGFVFLPDIYADQLIAESSGLYAHYSDLLPCKDSSGKSVSFHFLYVTSGDVTRKWRIVGVYHAKGYNVDYLDEEISYNDSNFGAALNGLGAPFLIAYDYSFFSTEMNGFAIFAKSRQFTIWQTIQTIVSFDAAGTSNVSFYSSMNGASTKMSGYSQIPGSFLTSSDVSFFYFLFMILSLISAFSYFVAVKRIDCANASTYAVQSLLAPLAFSLVGSACARFFGSNCPGLYAFFSYYFGAFVLLILAISVGVFIYKIRQKKRMAYER